MAKDFLHYVVMPNSKDNATYAVIRQQFSARVMLTSSLCIQLSLYHCHTPQQVLVTYVMFELLMPAVMQNKKNLPVCKICILHVCCQHIDLSTPATGQLPILTVLLQSGLSCMASLDMQRAACQAGL